jgi:CelD/BcsL family acetyltransferase involved in cellulose biosynthesis
MARGHVRPVEAADIPQVAELHRKRFGPRTGNLAEVDRCYRYFFREVFLDNPSRDNDLPSIVYEAGGKIVGFLGVTLRPVQLNGHSIRAAVSSMFMVDPENSLSGLAAVQLLRCFMSGPQDFSFADEATTPTRRLWERYGGTTSLLHSMYWTRPLRPAAFLNVRLRHKRNLGTIMRLSDPLCAAADAVLARATGLAVQEPRGLLHEDLDEYSLLDYCRESWVSETAHPQYDARSLRWLLEMANHGGAGGTLYKIAVRNPVGKPLGWYLYYLSKDGIAEVLQVGSTVAPVTEVLDHLLAHAAARGAVAATGRFDPRIVQDLGYSLTLNPRYWMLVHSRDPELLHLLERGAHPLTRLDGEWCLQFHIARYAHLNSNGNGALSVEPASFERDHAIRNGHTSARSSFHSKIIKGGVDALEELAPDWRLLSDRSAVREPFYRPEWAIAHMHAFSPNAQVAIATAESGSELKAVLPLVEERCFFYGVPVRKFRGAANVHSCRFDMVRADGADGEAAAGSIWRALKDMPGWDLIELPDVPEGGALEELIEVARRENYPVARRESMHSPYIPLDGLQGDDAPWLTRTSANFRSTVRRTKRQLSELGNVALHRITSADPERLQSFYELERSGWKGQKGTAIACDERTRHFYDEIAGQAEKFKYLSLFFLELDGKPIAAQFGITYGGRYFMPKMAFDERYRRFGPGHLLIHEILNDCVQRGLFEYDFTGPAAEYKGKWSPAQRTHSTFWIFQKGVSGRVLHAMKFKWETRLKDFLRPRWMAMKRRSRL